MLLFTLAGLLAVYALQRVQGVLPLTPTGLGAVSPDSSFNTAVSFATNTNWQGYGGEVTMSYLTQMLGLTVQNFVSAASGMCVLVALVRGLARRTAETIGNFWVDLTEAQSFALRYRSRIQRLLPHLRPRHRLANSHDDRRPTDSDCRRRRADSEVPAHFVDQPRLSRRGSH